METVALPSEGRASSSGVAGPEAWDATPATS
eukprot:CAMPEP_0118881776 /NCGR_PEP_ID=MMETSP1163-20130328/21173_1 /TAXON_ID=124430 /ORGANISM="Phaeomonas parva, Strain CCMP2877" /LENGTH=30 /DNA_ID= /DNA_START= /DNA_END= /DNA_ORIENTATION=